MSPGAQHAGTSLDNRDGALPRDATGRTQSDCVWTYSSPVLTAPTVLPRSKKGKNKIKKLNTEDSPEIQE